MEKCWYLSHIQITSLSWIIFKLYYRSELAQMEHLNYQLMEPLLFTYLNHCMISQKLEVWKQFKSFNCKTRTKDSNLLQSDLQKSCCWSNHNFQCLPSNKKQDLLKKSNDARKHLIKTNTNMKQITCWQKVKDNHTFTSIQQPKHYLFSFSFKIMHLIYNQRIQNFIKKKATSRYQPRKPVFIKHCRLGTDEISDVSEILKLKVYAHITWNISRR